MKKIIIPFLIGLFLVVNIAQAKQKRSSSVNVNNVRTALEKTTTKAYSLTRFDKKNISSLQKVGFLSLSELIHFVQAMKDVELDKKTVSTLIEISQKEGLEILTATRAILNSKGGLSPAAKKSLVTAKVLSVTEKWNKAETTALNKVIAGFGNLSKRFAALFPNTHDARAVEVLEKCKI